MINLQYLEWDSALFDLKIGKVEFFPPYDFSELFILLENNKKEYDLIYIYSEIPINELNRYLVDVKTLFKFDLTASQIPYVDNIKITTYTDLIPTSELYNLSLVSGTYSRFKLDKKLPIGAFEKLYKTWIEKSVNKEIADVVFIHKNENCIIDAMCTLKYKTKTPHIGIIAVNKESCCKGIGSALLLKAKQKTSICANAKALFVTTQLKNNIALCLYQKNGFKMIKNTYVYHYWYI